MVQACVCGGDSPDCQSCAGTGVASNNQVRIRTQQEKLEAIASSIATSGNDNISPRRYVKWEGAAYRDRVEQNFKRMHPAQICPVLFGNEFSYEQQPPSYIASLTKKLLDQIHGTVYSILWQTPQACTVTQVRTVSWFRVGDGTTFEECDTLANNIAKQNSPISKPSKPTLQKVTQTKPRDVNPTLPKKSPQPKIQAKKIENEKSTSRSNVNPRKINQPPPHNQKTRPDLTPFNSTMADKMNAAIYGDNSEKLLDATRGYHAFREAGTQRFGSYPTYDDYDN